MKYMLLLSLLWLTVATGATHAAGPDLLLLDRWREDLDVEGWLVSEKLDGVRAYWDGERLISRQGNAFAAPAWFVEGFPDFELDGELWTGRSQFEQVISIVSRDKPHEGWRRVSFNIFEVPNQPGGLLQRLELVRQHLQQRPVSHLRIIPQQPLVSGEALQQRLARVEAQGGEGLVLRKPDQPYVSGRSKQALKLKSYQDAEARVVGYRPGKGKYAGQTGALQVETAEGRRFYLGSGLSDAQRRSPPSLGTLVTYRHYGFTAHGLPRFASFLRVRVLP